MKKILFLSGLLFLGIQQMVMADAPPKDFVGFTEKIWAGEIDPHHVGDVCIAMIRSKEDQKLYGLVDFDEACQDTYGHLGIENKWVTAHQKNISVIANKAQLRALKRFQKDVIYLKINNIGNITEIPIGIKHLKEARLNSFKVLRSLSDYMASQQIGGNSGDAESYQITDIPKELDIKDVIQQLLYTEEGTDQKFSLAAMELTDRNLENAVSLLFSAPRNLTELNQRTLDFSRLLLHTLTFVATELKNLSAYYGQVYGATYTTSFLALRHTSKIFDEVLMMYQGEHQEE